MPEIKTLKTPEEVSKAINGVVGPERLIELAETGLAPHYQVDDNIYFAMAEIKEWLNHNWMARHPGQHIGGNFATIINVVAAIESDDKPPIELRCVSAFLVPLKLESVETLPFSGVYFLVSNNRVVYVGQSVNVFNRIGSHFGSKTFDSAWFMRVPKSDLNYVEGAFIRHLKPKYNHSQRGKIVAPPENGANDKEPAPESQRQVAAIPSP